MVPHSFTFLMHDFLHCFPIIYYTYKNVNTHFP
jgi:hypothetical protein